MANFERKKTNPKQQQQKLPLNGSEKNLRQNLISFSTLFVFNFRLVTTAFIDLSFFLCALQPIIHIHAQGHNRSIG